GQGTTVRLYLPRERQQEDLATELDTGPIAGGTETILAVEDDEEVRATVVEMLADLGYSVLRAKDAQSALAIVESGVTIDLLFTDVVMPGPLRSPELARKTRERLPNVAVLFTSGYTENAIVHGGRLDEGIDLLSKPYTREALARKIRHVLRNQQQRNAAQDVRQHRLPVPTAARDGGTAVPLRVLLVEDDGLIRSSTAEILEAMGHSVVPAEHASEALAALDGDRIDILMTDIGLPGVSGLELAAQARQRHPDLRVVFASGLDAAANATSSTLADAIHLLKPYTPEDLARALDTLRQAV
ncbi:MAG TPA: response regulator, partial [Bordetella sp.]|nr:response regulator [Bordetella sp.]